MMDELDRRRRRGRGAAAARPAVRAEGRVVSGGVDVHLFDGR
jgi:hypothetical protein